MKRTAFRTTGMLAVAALVAVFGGVPTAVADDAKVTLCHATDSSANPYVVKTVSESSIFNNGIVPNGHGAHTGPIFNAAGGKKQAHWGDIIPAFGTYGGLNVDDGLGGIGMSWLGRDCKKPPPLQPPSAPSILVQKFATLNDPNHNGRVDAGETISYSFEVTNTGGPTLTGITVADPMLGSALVTCSPSTLLYDATAACSTIGTYIVTQANIDAGTAITNVATATGTPVGGGGPVKDTGDATVSLRAVPGISVVKTATLNDPNHNGRVDAGETIGYSFVVKNTGNVTLTGITVTDPMLGSALVSCSPSELPPGATAACSTIGTYIVTLTDVQEGQPITNTATAKGWTSDDNSVTARGTASTPTQKPTQQGGGSTEPVLTTPSDPARITLSATVNNHFGGKAKVSDFTLTATGRLAPAAAAQNSFTPLAVSGTTPISFSGITGAADITNAAVPAGTYALSVSALPQGYSKSIWACHGGEQSGAEFTVRLGQSARCNITILDSAASVIPTVVTPVLAGEVVTAPPTKVPTKVVKGAVVPKAPVVAPNKVTQLAFTGAETVPLGLSGLIVLLLGVGLILVSRRMATD
jgi:uncharacterized repeat protein (TIGR01451 family)